LLTRREGRAAALIVAGVVGVIAMIPGASGPPTLVGWDKLDHAAAFAALALLARCGWPGTARWIVASLALGYGIAIELAQATAAVGRVASVSDVAADAVGIVIGLALAWGLARIARLLPFLDRHR
jgi:VanZ family protein